MNIENNQVDFYCSWIPLVHGGDQLIRDTEIGINAIVAEALGRFKNKRARSSIFKYMILCWR